MTSLLRVRTGDRERFAQLRALYARHDDPCARHVVDLCDALADAYATQDALGNSVNRLLDRCLGAVQPAKDEGR